VLTFEQINAENQNPALSDEQIMALELLVKRWPVYQRASGQWPLLHERLVAEKTTPTVKTKALKAVLTALAGLPAVVAETQGTDKEPAFFSTVQNWEALAEDTLNILYDLPVTWAAQSFVLVQRRIEDLIITDAGRIVL
jgi:hypothetical protein